MTIAIVAAGILAVGPMPPAVADDGGDAAVRGASAAAEPAPTEVEENWWQIWRSRDRLTGDWFGARRALEDRGVSISSSLIVDGARNFHGGVRVRSSLRYLYEVGVHIDLDELTAWKGASLYCDLESHGGRDGSLDTGDLQGYDNIDADARTQIYQVWAQQELLSGSLRIRLGRLDANREFAALDYGGDFLNSSFGYSPTIVGFPTYPDPAAGVTVRWESPNSGGYFGAGAFDGRGRGNLDIQVRDTNVFLGLSSEAFLIAEAGWRRSTDEGQLAGRYAVGGWHLTSPIERLDGRTEPGTSGLYATVDQQLWRASPDRLDDERGIRLCLQYGYADPNISPIEHHFGAGLSWLGSFFGRENDLAGIGVTWNRLSDEAVFRRSAETAFEVFYGFQFVGWMMLEPDLQYIRHPGGMPSTNDVLVGVLRATFTF